MLLTDDRVSLQPQMFDQLKPITWLNLNYKNLLNELFLIIQKAYDTPNETYSTDI